MQKRIGDFFVEKGLITPAQVQDILTYSSQNKIRFGEAAVALGLVTYTDLIRVFGPHWSVDFFHLHPNYLPESTRKLFPTDFLIQYGCVPLGFKKTFQLLKFKSTKVLNIGFLNPSNATAIKEAEAMARKSWNTLSENAANEFGGLKVYLVLGDALLDVFEKCYGITAAQLRSLPKDQVSETLQEFLAQD